MKEDRIDHLRRHRTSFLSEVWEAASAKPIPSVHFGDPKYGKLPFWRGHPSVHFIEDLLFSEVWEAASAKLLPSVHFGDPKYGKLPFWRGHPSVHSIDEESMLLP